MAISITLAFSATPGTSTANAEKIHWHEAGASIYGGFCNESETKGYRGTYLPGNPWGFAELGMGSAMGGLPNGTRVRVLDPVTHKRKWIVKDDIGAGGDSVEGLPREIDLYAPTAAYLAGASCSWTGRILWRLKG